VRREREEDVTYSPSADREEKEDGGREMERNCQCVLSEKRLLTRGESRKTEREVEGWVEKEWGGREGRKERDVLSSSAAAVGGGAEAATFSTLPLEVDPLASSSSDSMWVADLTLVDLDLAGVAA